MIPLFIITIICLYADDNINSSDDKKAQACNANHERHLPIISSNNNYFFKQYIAETKPFNSNDYFSIALAIVNNFSAKISTSSTVVDTCLKQITGQIYTNDGYCQRKSKPRLPSSEPSIHTHWSIDMR